MRNSFLTNLLNPSNWRGAWKQAQLAWLLLIDPRVPVSRKLIPVFVLFYIVSPLDLIPGFIPILGQLDDLALLLLGIRLFIQVSPPEVVDELRRKLG
jgi:uncharacterized membrane protein YkvA (DUF1232 family)